MDEEAKKMVDDAYVRTLALLKAKREQIQAIAELLLVKETINHDDIVGAIGSRPFTNHQQYQEFIDSTKNKPTPKQDDKKEEDKKEEDTTAPPVSPGLA